MDDAACWALDGESVQAWPCLSEERLGSWILRFADGLYGRSNSVQPYGQPRCGLNEAVRVVELAYRNRGLTPTFRIPKIGPTSELESLLEARGYAAEESTLVQTRILPSGIAGASVDSLETADAASGVWLDAYCRLNPRVEGKEATVEAIYSRVGVPGRFALVRRAGEPVAAGMGVVVGTTIWVFGMATATGYRRQGLASGIMTHLLRWGASEGAVRAALQVPETSLPAIGLYGRGGFATVYRYHYRRRR